jgi:hypothetical protein
MIQSASCSSEAAAEGSGRCMIATAKSKPSVK